MSRTDFYWSYPFFYYTFLKHYQNESRGVSGFAPFMAVGFVSFWWGAVAHAIAFFLASICSINEVFLRFFQNIYDSMGIVAIAALIFVPNALFFLFKKRYRVYENRYDGFSSEVKKRGYIISWAVMFSGICLLLYSLYRYASSNC